MDSLREAVYLRAYGQKDPLVEYKTEAYEMFTELMANIKGEVLHNLFRSTSNLMAFEQFLSSLPTHLLGADLDAPPALEEPAGPDASSMELPTYRETSQPVHRDAPKVGRNDPCPCGSGKKFKSCCGRNA